MTTHIIQLSCRYYTLISTTSLILSYFDYRLTEIMIEAAMNLRKNCICLPLIYTNMHVCVDVRKCIQVTIDSYFKKLYILSICVSSLSCQVIILV